MKIISANRLDESMMGDTHTALAGSLQQVDRSMAALGLRGAAMDHDHGMDGESGSRHEAQGWRTITIVFGRNAQELQGNSANNVILKLPRAKYDRNRGVFILKQYDAYDNFKTISFELVRVVAEPQVNEVYQIARLQNPDNLANPAVNRGYTVLMFTQLVANRKIA